MIFINGGQPAAESAMPSPRRAALEFYQRECQRQAKAIRLRDEWLQGARERLWERMERLRDLHQQNALPAPVAAEAASVAGEPAALPV
jgi:hypothetical protein